MSDSRAASGGVQRRVGALETPLSSEPGLWDWLTFDLLLHLHPLVAGHQEVHMLIGDILTQAVFVDAEIYRDLLGMLGFWSFRSYFSLYIYIHFFT